MKIGLTYNLNTDYTLAKEDPEDLLAEFDPPATIEELKETLINLGHKVIKIGRPEELLNKIDKFSLDIVFNMAEGDYGRNRESWAPIILEIKKIPYVGSDSLSLSICLDKLLTKKLLVFSHIPTPAFKGINHLEDLKNFNLKFPLMVKPRYEGSAKGIGVKSIVKDKLGLKAQVKFILNKYKQPAIVEEFIRGSEFTVAIIGNKNPEVLPIVPRAVEKNTTLSMHVLEKGKSSNKKLKTKKAMEITPELEKKLKNLSLETYRVLGCLDFARVDLRVDERNNPFVLEINPLPNLSCRDTFGLLAEYLNISYQDLINKILTASLRRWKINDKQ